MSELCMNYLIGDKVKLVKFTEQYMTPQYVGWLNNPEVNRYLNTGRFPVCRQELITPSGEKNLMFAIMSNIGSDSADKLWKDTEYNHYIGTCSLHDIDWISRKGEIGYMVGEKTHWGAGIATELIYLLTGYAFNRLNLNKLTAGVVEINKGSIKALEKNGFKQFAIFEQEYYLDGKYLDSYRFHNFKNWRKDKV